MENLRETFLKKYGIWEYIFLILGLIFLFSVGKEIITRPWEEFTLPIIGVMVLFVSIGALLVAKPLTILDMARKRVGMTTSEEKHKNN